jgi:hypothetical protein
MENGSIGENLSSSGENSIFTGVNNRFIGGKDPSIGERITEKRTRIVNHINPADLLSQAFFHT